MRATWMKVMVFAVCAASNAAAQEGSAFPVDPPANPDAQAPEGVGNAADNVREKVADKVSEVADQVNRDERAHELRAGILKPIYLLAEKLEGRPFHWLAFALMATGVVNFGLQLVLGKLVMLSRMKISLIEILSDGAAFAACLIGLVLATQAAAQNSKFTENSFSVLSATAVGAFFGLIFYWRGQSQEILAAKEEARQRKR